MEVSWSGRWTLRKICFYKKRLVLYCFVKKKNKQTQNLRKGVGFYHLQYYFHTNQNHDIMWQRKAKSNRPKGQDSVCLLISVFLNLQSKMDGDELCRTQRKDESESYIILWKSLDNYINSRNFETCLDTPCPSTNLIMRAMKQSPKSLKWMQSTSSRETWVFCFVCCCLFV